MPRTPRIQFAGGFYHVFNRGVEKRPIVQDERDRKTFIHFLADTVRRFQIELYAYCLMDNHYHLFLQTPQPNLGKSMHHLQWQYAHYFNLRYERVGGLFQSRYKSPVVEVESYAFALTRYIHRNPCEAGITKKPEDYPWSSYSSYLGILPAWNWLNMTWLLNQFHHDQEKARTLFKSFHDIPSPQEEYEQIEKMKPILGQAPGPVPRSP